MNIVVDVEADGPIPGKYSMVSFGAVLVSDTNKTFYGKTAPISPYWVDEALAVSGVTREQHASFDNPEKVMQRFDNWLLQIKTISSGERLTFWSDNPAFDWQFINYYFHMYLGRNPFGFSARRIGDYYCGLMRNPRAQWKHLRKTKHDHNPVNDAKGNAEALKQMGIA